MMVKVYGTPTSTAAVRVFLCLEEVGATYQLVPIDFASGEHKSPAHLARNPFGQVPAFEDGDLILFESRAIARYVLRKFKSGTDLLHEGNLTEAALVDVWMEVEAQQFDKVMTPIITQLVYVPVFFGGTTDEKIVAEYLEKLVKVLDVYEDRLSRSKFLAGDFISLADICHIPLIHHFMNTPHASVVNERPHVKAWWESLTSRPSYKKIFAAFA